jgi:hypothetical protein
MSRDAAQAIKAYGGFVEVIQWKDRAFHADDDLGKLAALLKDKPAADIKGAGRGEAPAMRTGARQGGMPIERARELAASITKAWSNAPKLSVVESPAALPFDAEPDALGAYWRGTLYVVASNHDSAADLQFTVFHEGLGHFGLRGLFGKELDPVLRELEMRNANLRRAAADWMANNPKPKDWSAEDHRLQAIEEALADLAGSGKQITGFKKVIAAMQRWLRAHGFDAWRIGSRGCRTPRRSPCSARRAPSSPGAAPRRFTLRQWRRSSRGPSPFSTPSWHARSRRSR